jgi:hypothetical protein
MSRIRFAASLLSAIGATLVAGSAWAQEPDPATPPPTLPSASTNPAPPDRFGLFDGGHLTVSAGQEEDELTFKVALPTGPSLASRFSLSASTPLQDDDQSLPADLDALANGTRVTLSWGYFQVPVSDPDQEAIRIEQRAQAACRAAQPGQLRCDDTAFAVWNYARTDWVRYQRHSMGAATDFGIDATVGINDFEWVDATTLLPQKKQHTDWSVAAHVARYLAGTHTALTASVAYQRAYKAAEEELACPPVVTNPATDCKMARLGAPSVDKNFLLAAGIRHRFADADGNLLNLAVAPLVTYDVKDGVWGVDVPVYVTPGKDGALTGGIRFGYRSDREDKFSVGLFVGTTFSIWQH